jgi:hypothetical protein
VRNVRPMGRRKDQWEEAGHNRRNGASGRKDETNVRKDGINWRQ